MGLHAGGGAGSNPPAGESGSPGGAASDDRDGDGVPDADDPYPDDALLSFADTYLVRRSSPMGFDLMEIASGPNVETHGITWRFLTNLPEDDRGELHLDIPNTYPYGSGIFFNHPDGTDSYFMQHSFKSMPRSDLLLSYRYLGPDGVALHPAAIIADPLISNTATWIDAVPYQGESVDGTFVKFTAWSHHPSMECFLYSARGEAAASGRYPILQQTVYCLDDDAGQLKEVLTTVDSITFLRTPYLVKKNAQDKSDIIALPGGNAIASGIDARQVLAAEAFGGILVHRKKQPGSDTAPLLLTSPSGEQSETGINCRGIAVIGETLVCEGITEKTLYNSSFEELLKVSGAAESILIAPIVEGNCAAVLRAGKPTTLSRVPFRDGNNATVLAEHSPPEASQSESISLVHLDEKGLAVVNHDRDARSTIYADFCNPEGEVKEVEGYHYVLGGGPGRITLIDYRSGGPHGIIIDTATLATREFTIPHDDRGQIGSVHFTGWPFGLRDADPIVLDVPASAIRPIPSNVEEGAGEESDFSDIQIDRPIDPKIFEAIE